MEISLIAGDICTFCGGAIVNAANEAMLGGGGGVDGAIHRAAGYQLKRACAGAPVLATRPRSDDIEGEDCDIRCLIGGAVPVPGFDLLCKWVINTVGPIWPKDGDDPTYVARMMALVGMQMKVGLAEISPDKVARALLRDCFRMAMLTAMGMGLKSIAYPAISTGVYGCSQVDCAQTAMNFVKDYRSWPIDVTIYLYPACNLPIWQAMAEHCGVQLAPAPA